MLRLRPYKPCDANTILGWIKDEDAFRKWSTDRYPHYPITAEEMNHKYMDCNGDCAEPDNFYPMTAFDDSGIVGHLIMRFTDAEKSTLRFGFVIVDDSRRGMGYGKQMLGLALRFAFDILKVQKVTLGVLENNPGAYHCYKAAGFKDVPMDKPEYYHLMGEKIKCLELETEGYL
jgi:RimJ/RimL family protein N-acetyltransferase